jgi:hypothetical protein
MFRTHEKDSKTSTFVISDNYGPVLLLHQSGIGHRSLTAASSIVWKCSGSSNLSRTIKIGTCLTQIYISLPGLQNRPLDIPAISSYKALRFINYLVLSKHEALFEHWMTVGSYEENLGGKRHFHMNSLHHVATTAFAQQFTGCAPRQSRIVRMLLLPGSLDFRGYEDDLFNH